MTSIARSSLLRLGAAAGPFYVIVAACQILTRDGFDVRRHAVSQLSNGDFGWIQVGNFLASGALVLAGAAGLRRALGGGPAGTWAPRLLGVYGAGLIGAGLFRADPGRGFPPGMSAPAAMTGSGLLHFVFGGIGFYALIAACFVMTRRFLRERRYGWAAWSLVTGAGFFAAFAAIASGSTAETVMLGFYAAIAWIWIWHCAVHLDALRS